MIKQSNNSSLRVKTWKIKNMARQTIPNFKYGTSQTSFRPRTWKQIETFFEDPFNTPGFCGNKPENTVNFFMQCQVIQCDLGKPYEWLIEYW